MYDVRIIFTDYRNYDVTVDEDQLEEFLKAISEGRPFYDKVKSVGFCFPAVNVRCAYAIRKLTQPQVEPCQSYPVSEAENASIS